MPFTGQEVHTIGLGDATKLTENYRKAQSSGATLGGYFSQAGIMSILQQDGCKGIRIYYGREQNGAQHFVLVGVKSDGEDLFDGEIADYSYQCPPYCPLSSPLNGTA